MDLGDGVASMYALDSHSSASGSADWQTSSHSGVVDGLVYQYAVIVRWGVKGTVWASLATSFEIDNALNDQARCLMTRTLRSVAVQNYESHTSPCVTVLGEVSCHFLHSAVAPRCWQR